MAVNATGPFRRTPETADEDIAQTITNIQAESWKTWPNEAGVSSLFALHSLNHLTNINPQFVGLQETNTPIPLKVTGHIPSWSAGALYRTGPGGSEIPTDTRGTHYITHWFDGFGQTHKFDIISSANPEHSASVRYSSCTQAKGLVEGIKKRGWRSSFSFAQKADPCVGIFAKMTATFRPLESNCSVVVERNLPGGLAKAQKGEAGHGTATDNVFLFTDSSSIQEVDAETLQPVKHESAKSLHPQLSGPLGCAHSQRDPKTGDLFNFNLAFGRKPVYRIFRVNAASGTTDILASITVPDAKPAYIHSLFLTENHVVLCIPSSHYGWGGMKIPWEGNIADAIEPFHKSKLMQWIVVDRKADKGIVARFNTPAGFFFHSINAFEEQTPEGVKINCDVVWYENMDIIKGFYYDVILDRQSATKKHWLDESGYKSCRQYLRRYCFSLPHEPQKKSFELPEGELLLDIPAPHVGELPTINPSYATKPYRYVYTAGSRGLSTLIDCIVKTDLQTKEALLWGAPKGHTPGEAVFVARPKSSDEEADRDEDDGVLLSVVLDGTAKKSYLLVLDARTMEEKGRAECEVAVGVGFHGEHAPEIRSSL